MPPKRNHFLYFGLPFFISMLGATFLLSKLTQGRYDFHDRKIQMVDKEEELRLDSKRKKIDLREVYFDLTKKKELDDWDFVRIERKEEPVWAKNG
ncbi:hypothetical protein HDV05_002149, partial [Chytridiales sp. JEL 0842]